MVLPKLAGSLFQDFLMQEVFDPVGLLVMEVPLDCCIPVIYGHSQRTAEVRCVLHIRLK
jgi:hypothetical protein